MDYRLEPVDKIMNVIDTDNHDDTRKELGFAILALDDNDPATLYWLAAVAVKRASDLHHDDERFYVETSGQFEPIKDAQMPESLQPAHTISYEEAVSIANGLKSHHDSNPEYDRALCELIGDMFGKQGMPLDERKLEVANDLEINL